MQIVHGVLSVPVCVGSGVIVHGDRCSDGGLILILSPGQKCVNEKK